MTNPWLGQLRDPHDKKIIYTTLQTKEGWRILASLPRRISPDDQIKIIDWFHSYRSAVRHQHPLWLTSFSAGEQFYSLDIFPKNDPKQMVAGAVEASENWKQMGLFDYAWRHR